MDLELRKKWLRQHKELFGNSIYVENLIHHNDNNVDLEIFHQQIKDCQKCLLGSERTNFVFGIGKPDADFVFVGGAPGEEEDIKGEPFVGPSGDLLNKILAAINLNRDDVFILNVLKCRPPHNRNPEPNEVEQCEPYLKTQIQLINPKLIIALGQVAAQILLKINLPLNKMREKVFRYEGIDVLVTYHPMALLRNPDLKRPTWEDFKKIKSNYILE